MTWMTFDFSEKFDVELFVELLDSLLMGTDLLAAPFFFSGRTPCGVDDQVRNVAASENFDLGVDSLSSVTSGCVEEPLVRSGVI